MRSKADPSWVNCHGCKLTRISQDLGDLCPPSALGQEQGPRLPQHGFPPSPGLGVFSENTDTWTDTQIQCDGQWAVISSSPAAISHVPLGVTKLLSVAGLLYPPLGSRQCPRSGRSEQSCVCGGLAWGQMSRPGPHSFHGEAGDSCLLKPPRAGTESDRPGFEPQ